MNIDFSNHPGFSAYVLLLIFCGIVMTLMAITMHRSTNRLRILNAVFGVGYLGYGLYLALFFHGGTYLIFFKAFIVPVVLVVGALRRQLRSGARATHTPTSVAVRAGTSAAPATGATAVAPVAPVPTVAAGWYPDPADPSRARWWDGYAWGPLAPQS